VALAQVSALNASACDSEALLCACASLLDFDTFDTLIVYSACPRAGLGFQERSLTTSTINTTKNTAPLNSGASGL
jgi:CII-binding regulator of phage lambda lysogenization HflD